MAKNFSELKAGMTPASRARAEAATREMLREMPLHELRQARRLTQENLAEALNTTQASVSKMERRTDMYVSTLRRYVRAMGGELEITARFPDGDVVLDQFGDLDPPAESALAV